MEANEVLAKVTEIVAEQAETGVEDITPDTRLIGDLGFDSLDVIQTIMEMEDEFEISAEDEDESRCRACGRSLTISCASSVKWRRGRELALRGRYMGLDVVEFIMDCEDAFAIEIPDAKLSHVRTMGDFFDVVLPLVRDTGEVELRGRPDLPRASKGGSR